MNAESGIIAVILILLPFTPFIIYYIVFWRRRFFLHSHWDVLIDDFSFSSQEFYKLLKEEIYTKKISSLRFTNVSLKEGNMFSSRRRYLRIYWKDLHFDVCAAPFGKGFFLSWWLVYRYTFWEWVIILIPFFGFWLHSILYKSTYYKHDTGTMFMKYVHQCVLEIFDELTISHGVRLLPEDERKPIMNDIFNR